MDILKAMKVFVAVVENGSFIGASYMLDTSNAAVSRHIAALEVHLGVLLLNRTTRRISLTDAGKDFFSRSQQVLADVAEAEGIASLNTVNPSGLLRISAPLSFGISRLGEWLPEFVKRYPELTLDLDLTDRMVDLAADGIDVAVRIARQPSITNVVVKKIAPVKMLLCASPEYLQRRGIPMHPTDLAKHDTVGFSYMDSGNTWAFTNDHGQSSVVNVRPRIYATNGDVLREFAMRGLGVAIEPSFIVDKQINDGSLVSILEDWRLEEYNMYAIYLTRRFLPAKVRVFIDYLVEMERVAVQQV